MTFRGYREESRKKWGTSDDGLNLEEIQTGALLRIADATEKMCLDREKLERGYKYMRAQRDIYRSDLETERRRSAALRGVINRMRKQHR